MDAGGINKKYNNKGKENIFCVFSPFWKQPQNVFLKDILFLAVYFGLLN